MQLTDEYNNLQVQRNNIRHTVQFGEEGFSEGNEQNVEQVMSLDPAGGLARDEAAELVALEIESIAVDAKGTVVGEGNIDVSEMGTFSTDPEYPFTTTEVNEDSTSDPGFVETYSNDDDPDTLDTWLTHHGAYAFDETDGVGYGLTGYKYSRYIPFRPRFGEGPVMDRHDTIYLHKKFIGPDLDEGTDPLTVGFLTTSSWFWDVYIED